MQLIAAIFVLALGGQESGEATKPNLFPVAISYSAPPTFEICKSIEPEHAANYDRELRGWHLRNDAAVEQLKLVLAKQIEADGRSTLDHIRDVALATVEEFRSLPVESQRPGCRQMYLYVGNN